ncbi:MAG: PilN domain-containing protein [Acidobacteriota bacterium]
MKLDVNLAREPFRSYRTLYAVSAVLAVAGVAILAFEVATFVGDLRARSALTSELARLRDASEREQTALGILASYVENEELKAAKAEAAHVASLIERRIFDWDELFRELESIMPNNVRISDLHPQIKGSSVSIGLNGSAKTLSAVNEFVDDLEKSELFDEVFISDEATHEGEVDFSLQARYVGRGTLEIKKGSRT